MAILGAAAPVAAAAGPVGWAGLAGLAGLNAITKLGDWFAGKKRDERQLRAAREAQIREHGWRSGEAEKDRAFNREQRARREQLYEQFVNLQREEKLAWEQRRGTSLRAAAGVLPNLAGVEGVSLQGLIDDSAARTSPGAALTTPITLPELSARAMPATSGVPAYAAGTPGASPRTAIPRGVAAEPAPLVSPAAAAPTPMPAAAGVTGMAGLLPPQGAMLPPGQQGAFVPVPGVGPAAGVPPVVPRAMPALPVTGALPDYDVMQSAGQIGALAGRLRGAA